MNEQWEIIKNNYFWYEKHNPTKYYRIGFLWGRVIYRIKFKISLGKTYLVNDDN